MTTIGAGTAGWDTRGNLASDPVSGMTYGYSSEDLSTSASGGVTLDYDPLQRLVQIAEPAITRFAYDGLNEIAEYNASNVLQRRFVFDPSGQPLVQYEEVGADSGRRFMSADERGSIIARTRSDGSLFAINRYDEYGKPQSSNSGRFGYTGQAWISQVGLNYYKARMYAPHLGLFAQTDPLGMRGGANFYAYVGGDPVNRVDPLGMQVEDPSAIYVNGKRLPQPDDDAFGSGFAGGGDPFGGSSTGGFSGGPPGASGEDIVVIGQRQCSEEQSIGGCGDIVVTANPSPSETATLPSGVRVLPAAAPRGFGVLEILRAILDLRGDSCPSCNQAEFPTDPSNLKHIFSDRSGHFPEDTRQNRALILGAVSPQFFVGTNRYGVDVYRQNLRNGSQIWVEVYNNTISNAGLNPAPR